MKTNDKRKGILIISLYFVPSIRAGAKRFTFLSPILKSKYPDLHILTLKESYFSPRDDSLSFSGTVHRTGIYPAYPLKRNNFIKKILKRLWVDYLCLVDPYSGWIVPALIRGLKILKENRIDLIITTCPPFSAIVVGFLLSRLTKVKLLLDYRDPWTNHNRKFCKIFGKRIGLLFERLSVKQASALVFCSRIMKENFNDSLGKYSKAPRHVITNGFHGRNTSQQLVLEKGKKSMIYAGTFYGQRKIGFLSKPLLKLLDEGSITKDSFCVHVFGELTDEDSQVLRESDLLDIIKVHDAVSYEQMITYLKTADILFLISAPDVRYAIPLKFFDYLSVRRPILAVAAKDSAVADLMNEIDCGRLALINSQESILHNLRMMIFEEKEYSYSGIELYTWEKIGEEYLRVIDEVAC
ncbi:MAG: glycosyltransferase [Desulfobacterales bacterium]|nr:glycosyltransferase [Desulfobacterales bacterium]